VSEDWAEANQRHLTAAVAVVADALERRDGEHAHDDVARAELEAATAAMPAPPALDRLCASFGLSPFERDLLLLCAGAELDAAFAARCRELGPGGPTFALGLAALPGAHWSALTPASPLRYWRLVEPVAPGEPLTSGPLRIDERVLHFLAGTAYLDPRLADLLAPLSDGGDLPPSQRLVAERIARLWTAGPDPPAIALEGDDRWARRAVVGDACRALGLTAFVLAAAEVPASASERAALTRLWERETLLLGGALMVEVDDADGFDAHRAAAALAERLRGPLVLAGRDPARAGARSSVALNVTRPTAPERHALWEESLGASAGGLNGRLEPLVGQFHLGAREIRLAAGEASAEAADEPDALAGRLWAACRRHARPRLEDLAQRIDADVTWDDLVLPEAERRTLCEIAVHVRQRVRVYDAWAFGARGARGLGISALFHGSSGTGKTLAAEVLASELDLDLYRIDLSQVVSKYIGETEKNLRRVFDAAEHGGAILLFDEADALFGRRSEVKDSHDRYANIEVGYLLQRMEAYRGLAILTTNQKSALDPAFMRRLRFIVAFPFPDAEQRALIWRRVFPDATPTDGLDPERLAQLHVAGGSIRNVALGAAFRAADAGSRVTMARLLEAAQIECAKLERPLSEVEVGGWT
jgi:ATPase family associated with various cellular activities (AAA)